MTIRYKNSYRYRMLIFGVAFLLLGLSTFVPGLSGGALGGFIGIGVVYIGGFIFMTKRQYLYIAGDHIKKYGPPSSRIYFSEVTETRYFAGDYIIKAGKREITISKDLIAPSSMPEFEFFWQKIQRYNVIGH